MSCVVQVNFALPSLSDVIVAIMSIRSESDAQNAKNCSTKVTYISLDILIAMDHFRVPENCQDQGIVVPYLGLVKYDKGGLGGFLGRLGYTPTQFLVIVEKGDQRPLVESILQEWLYFGTLHAFSEVTQVSLDLEEFIQRDAGKTPVLNSKHLLSYLAVTVDKAREYTQADHDQIRSVLDHDARVLADVVRRFTVWFEHLTPSILFSIFILMESLTEAYRLLSGQYTSIVADYMSPSPGIYFGKIMKRNGWCLADIQGQLHSTTSVAYFLNLLPSFNGPEHEICTLDKCNFATRTVNQPVRLHNTPICSGDCQKIAIPPSDLTQILERGSYPVIQCLNDGQDMTLQVVEAKDYEYTAISHVW